MLAAQRHDEEMQGRRFAQERHAAAQSQGQQLVLSLLSAARNEMRRVSFLVKVVARGDIERDQALEFLGRERDEIARDVRDQNRRRFSLKTQGKKIDGAIRSLKRFRREKPGHDAPSGFLAGLGGERAEGERQNEIAYGLSPYAQRLAHVLIGHEAEIRVAQALGIPFARPAQPANVTAVRLIDLADSLTGEPVGRGIEGAE